MRQILFSTIVLLLVHVNGLSQGVPALGLSETRGNSQTFEHFTGADGLAQDSPYCIFQDSKGFLWIGTGHGLSRFDGYQFVNFRRDFREQASLSDNRVNSIIETRSGDIWVGTRNGLNQYDPATNSFKSYKFASGENEAADSWVEVVFEDSGGTLWVGTTGFGLNRFDRATGKFTAFRNDPGNDASISGNSVTDILEDPAGELWISTLNGLNRFDRSTGGFRRFRNDPAVQNSLTNNGIRSMMIDRRGTIWLATAGGLNMFDPVLLEFTRYTAEKGALNGLDNNDVISVYEARSGAIWIGTQSGLNRFSRETGSFENYKHDPSDPNSLGEGRVLSIVEDNNEQLWVGTIVGGLNKFNQRTSRFRKYRHSDSDPGSIGDERIRSILEDKRHDLWIGTEQGLFLSRSGQGRFELIKGIEEYIGELHEDRDGKIWIVSTTRLISLDPETGKRSEFRCESGKLNFVNLTTIDEDRAGLLWLGGTKGELCRFDSKKEQFSLVHNELGIVGKLGESRILATLEDSQGQVWIGGRGGVFRLDPSTKEIKSYRNEPGNLSTLSVSPVGAIYEDKSGILWFGTSGGGLNRFDRTSSAFEHFTEREGMPIDNVYEILDDDHGNLWLSTDKGLSRFNMETRQFRNFDVNDGLTHNEFNDKAAFKNVQGEMYFGGQHGFVKFDPSQLTTSGFVPPVYLTDVRIMERPLSPAEDISRLAKLELSSSDYVVSFDFAALDFADPKKLHYQWKLEGFDPDWINGGTRRTATYTDLPGGDYVLKVKATNVDGIWTGEAVNLKIHVTPPFYKTAWFLTLVGIIVGLIIWRAFRYRIDQLRLASETQTRFTQQLITRQEAERKRIASELHDGLGQSLVIIKNRAELGLNKGDDKQRVIKELGSISESASQALEEVREITNNLRPQLLDRLGLTKAIQAMLKKAAGVIDIACEIDQIDDLFSEHEEISIYRIVQESLNNIIKHSNASNARVKIIRHAGAVSVTIEDNGKGFDPAEVNSERRNLGLVGLNERAQLLKGDLNVESKVGEGTKIQMTVPIKKDR